MKIKGTEVGTGRPLICVPVLEKTERRSYKRSGISREIGCRHDRMEAGCI